MSRQALVERIANALQRGECPAAGAFVAAETEEQADAVAEDPVLRSLLAVWPQARVSWSAPEGEPDWDAPPWKRWEDLWAGAAVDFEDLAAALGVDPDLAVRKFHRAKAARLIYPSGRVNRYGVMVLRSVMAGAAGLRVKGA